MKQSLFFLFFSILLTFGCKKQNVNPQSTENRTDSSFVEEDTLLFLDTLFSPKQSDSGNAAGQGSSGGDSSTEEREEETKSSPKDDTPVESARDVKDMGRIMYVVPDTMQVMKSYEIVVRISRDDNNREIIHQVQTLERVETARIKTTSRMQVELIDPQKDCFNINSINSGKQVVDSTFTEWKFNVQPLRSGMNKLNLIVSNFIDGDLKQQSYSDVIFVKTNPKAQIKNFWSDNWKWVFEKLIIPVVTWFFGFWIGRKKFKK